jgi:chemotaxis protein MotB
MNNLLVMFIMLYAISVIDLSKYELLVISFSNTFGKTTKTEDMTGTGDFSIEDLTKEQIAALTATPTPPPKESQKQAASATSTPEAEASLAPGETASPAPEATPEPTPEAQATADLSEEDEGEDEYDELVSRISKMLKANGYDKHITVEKIGDFIYLRFREGILFYPDVAAMRGGAAQVLSNVAAVVMDSYDLISNIDISGHTARISNDLPSKENLFSWELSTNRALTVLEYLVKKCDMPQNKLSVTGNSCNILMVEGDSEEQRAQNRRVEIRLTRAVS